MNQDVVQLIVTLLGLIYLIISFIIYLKTFANDDNIILVVLMYPFGGAIFTILPTVPILLIDLISDQYRLEKNLAIIVYLIALFILIYRYFILDWIDEFKLKPKKEYIQSKPKTPHIQLKPETVKLQSKSPTTTKTIENETYKYDDIANNYLNYIDYEEMINTINSVSYSHLSNDELNQISKYIYIFKKFDCSEHWEVNNIITAQDDWDSFDKIRSVVSAC